MKPDHVLPLVAFIIAFCCVLALVTGGGRGELVTPAQPIIVKPVVVEKTQSLVPRSSDRGLTPEARDLWYRCVDLFEDCEYESEWGPDGMLAETACENKVKDCHMLVSEANR